jgi:hypothetical protein
VVGIGEELKATAAGVALEVVFDAVGRPLRLEKILQWAGALFRGKDTLIDEIKKLAGELKILAWLIKAQALHERIALWARCHGNSLTLWWQEGVVTKVQQ